MKRLIVFDLDGTLAESKSPLDAEMSGLVHALLGIAKVAVTSGGAWSQFEAQLLSNLPRDEPEGPIPATHLWTKFLAYEEGWRELYSEDLTADEKARIVGALKVALAAAGFVVERVWGEAIEDRGSQVTFSALGQQAPLDAKACWDPDFAKRKKLRQRTEDWPCLAILSIGSVLASRRSRRVAASHSMTSTTRMRASSPSPFPTHQGSLNSRFCTVRSSRHSSGGDRLPRRPPRAGPRSREHLDFLLFDGRSRRRA